MRSTQVAQLLALASSAAASPLFGLPPFFPVCTQYNDSYDDLSSNQITPNAVTNYNGLSYAGFIVDGAGSNGAVTGVTPHSSPNVASATLQQDQQTFGSLTLNPFGTITAAQGTAYFALTSFYYGCSLGDHSSTGLSSGCDISVVGWDANGNQLPPLTYSYAPASTTNAAMVQASLPASYYALSRVTFGVATGSIVTADTVMHLDNVVHCNYS